MENKNRKLCKTCRYRTRDTMRVGNCEYILITGHSRGCPVENCDKYEKGKRYTVKDCEVTE